MSFFLNAGVRVHSVVDRVWCVILPLLGKLRVSNGESNQRKTKKVWTTKLLYLEMVSSEIKEEFLFGPQATIKQEASVLSLSCEKTNSQEISSVFLTMSVKSCVWCQYRAVATTVAKWGQLPDPVTKCASVSAKLPTVPIWGLQSSARSPEGPRTWKVPEVSQHL